MLRHFGVRNFLVAAIFFLSILKRYQNLEVQAHYISRNYLEQNSGLPLSPREMDDAEYDGLLREQVRNPLLDRVGEIGLVQPRFNDEVLQEHHQINAQVEMPLSGCVGDISEAEYEALQDLYLATAGADWHWHNISTAKSQWSFPSNLSVPCSDGWEGLYCEPSKGLAATASNNSCCITGLVLSLTNLKGQLPTSISKLRQLHLLSLQFNLLRGSIPTSLGDLMNLNQLYLNNNSLTGPIPSSLSALGVLTELGLNNNSLTGPIPSLLGGLNAIVQLNLDYNSLTGSIPSSLGDLTALAELYLNDNSLTGAMPTSLGDLAPLTVLDLSSNFLDGSIASSLGTLVLLTQLVLNYNFLTGLIPPSLGGLAALTLLYTYGNMLSGPIPSSVGDLTSLTLLGLNSNLLTGSIPTSLGSLKALTLLGLNDNSLSGLIPTSLGSLTVLTQLECNSNSLTGPIPYSLSGLASIVVLDVGSNFLTGSFLALSLFHTPNLEELIVANNKLTGTISSSVSLLKACFYLNASGNSLTGYLPAELGNLGSNLSVSGKLVGVGVALDLSQNAFSGTMPPTLFSQQMQTLLLYSNCMQGSIPTEICSSTDLQTLVLDKLTSGASCQMTIPGFKGTFVQATLQGSIPECVWTMPRLQTLRLSGNGLQGSLGDFKPMSELVNIDLSNNFLFGSIPISMQTRNASRLKQLALANNMLTGTLSPSFVVGDLTLLTLSINRLSGNIPASLASTQSVGTFSILSGNLFACGSSLPIADPARESYVCGSSTLNIGLYAIGSAVLVLVLLWLFVALGFVRYWGMDQLLSRGVACWDQYSEAVVKEANFGAFVSAVGDLRVWICRTGLVYAAVCMPVYAILKTAVSAGILTEQYTWVVTSAFLRDYASVGFIAVFVGASMVVLVTIIQNLNSLLNPAPAAFEVSDSGVGGGVIWKHTLQRAMLQTASLVIVFVVNVLYVYGLVFGNLSISEQLIALVALGFFKVVWQHQFVAYQIRWIEMNHNDISEGGLIFHQVTMNVVSFIIAPCLATLGTDSNCLYDALLGDPSILSSFNVTLFNSECITATYSSGEVHSECVQHPYQQPTTISIAPPWLYSYQCTSALLTNYIPVLLLISAFSAAVMPLLQYTVMSLPERIGTDLRLGKLLPKQHSAVPCYRRLVADILVDVAVLMTFGLACPLLGLIIALKQVTSEILSRLSVGRYLQQAEENSSTALAALEALAKRFRGRGAIPLFIFLFFVVGLFWGALIFDMLADVYSNSIGGIAWAVVFGGWVMVAAVAIKATEGAFIASRPVTAADTSSTNMVNALLAAEISSADDEYVGALNSDFKIKASRSDLEMTWT